MDSAQISQTLSSQWDEIKDEVRHAANLTTTVGYDTWLKPMEFASYNNGVLTIYLPEGLMHMTDYLTSRFALHIQVLTAERIGLPSRPEIVFKLRPEETPQPMMQTADQPSVPYATLLNPRYRFDTFVVGSNNNFAHSASLAVAESPGKAYNPLFLYGGPGLGKTHLMHSIAHMIMEENPSAKVLYVTCEQFTNEVIESIRQSKDQAEKMTQLREKYRTVDVLMIDDVQFLKGKTQTQEEFFHTFNELHQAGKQIVISSDRPPKEIETLEERLRSRFEGGLIADVQVPNYETRMAILRKNAEEDAVPFPIDERVFEYIAENITSNIRELEGAYKKVIASARMNHTALTFEDAQAALKDIIDPGKKKTVSTDRIMQIVCDHYQITREEIVSKKRNADIVLPRQVCMYLCRQILDLSLDDVGMLFGGKDHSTVISGVNKIKAKYDSDAAFRKTVDQLLAQVTM